MLVPIPLIYTLSVITPHSHQYMRHVYVHSQMQCGQIRHLWSACWTCRDVETPISFGFSARAYFSLQVRRAGGLFSIQGNIFHIATQSTLVDSLKPWWISWRRQPQVGWLQEPSDIVTLAQGLLLHCLQSNPTLASSPDLCLRAFLENQPGPLLSA